ncbi:hypothetical protein ZIOFF_013797 [Zingiber officinale]|uniref:Probable magnesium transporter n=1 Tax=Zingiber officinale TaxID=94328 RepID=A0A8J5HCH4_ZINOF|nr:hypothetical protein ZIOFF_013797 [Zingiber officinale]
MGDWVIGAFINIIGSIAINFGTNLLKLGHDQRERYSILSNDGPNSKLNAKSIIHFQMWRFGILLFAFGNCLNFISFAYAAQAISCSVIAVTSCSVGINSICIEYRIFLFCAKKDSVSQGLGSNNFYCFGEHFLSIIWKSSIACIHSRAVGHKVLQLSFPSILPFLTIHSRHQSIYLQQIVALLMVINVRKGEAHVLISGHDSPYWRTLLPFSYATVSGAIGSCSVLFAKSLSNMLRLTMSSNHQFHSWFTYCMLLLFFSTAGFWMARLNEGLSLFDAILIVPMFQIAWTFFSICTGFVYFQEYQVFDTLRVTMFFVGITLVFIGISLLAPDDSKGSEIKDSSLPTSAQGFPADMNRFAKIPTEDTEVSDTSSFAQTVFAKAKPILLKAKAAGSLSLGLGEEPINASSVLVMPMLASRTTGFRPTLFDRCKFIPLRNSGKNYSGTEDDIDDEMQDTRSLLS